MKPILLILFFLMVLSLTTKFRSELPIIKPKLYPMNEMGKLHFGFSNSLGDLFWLRLVQNIDYCEGRKSVAVNSGTNLDDILSIELSASRCNKGWVYQMLNVITDLAPKFRKVYRVGSEVLSVAVDDREGARLFFEKGLKMFPDYWELAYSASYHYLFEFQNPKRAAELLIQASEAGGPFWFRQMAGTLFTKAGQFVVAESTLKSYIANYYGQRGVGQAEIRLAELYVDQGMTKSDAQKKVEAFVSEVKLKLED